MGSMMCCFQKQEAVNSPNVISVANKGNQSRELDQAHCPLLTQPRKFPVDPVSQRQVQQEEGTSRSPIYKGQSGTEVMSDKSWRNGAGNHSRERLVRPGTPYTEIDESKVGLSKKVNVRTEQNNC